MYLSQQVSCQFNFLDFFFGLNISILTCLLIVVQVNYCLDQLICNFVEFKMYA